MILIGDEETSEDFSEEIDTGQEIENEDMLMSGDISDLHTLVGQNSLRSLRIMGMVGNKEVYVLIDSGSTHNFIQPSLAEKLKLGVKPIKTFRVFIGNSDSLNCSLICPNVQVELQGKVFYVDLHVLKIKGPDSIFGIPWLQGLGKIEHDYTRMEMVFKHVGEKVKLMDETNLEVGQVNFSMLKGLISRQQISGLFELHVVHEKNDEVSNDEVQFPDKIPTPICSVSEANRSIFKVPKSLPSHQEINHTILLQPNVQPVNVRPYSYPYYQKNEIEKLVQEMLDQEIIRPSTSPFSSPVLLVRKRDGTFRFCVDYKALNAVTIKDKFPIPTIDELLDELGGAKVFTKLDLRAGYHQIRVRDRDVYKTAFRTHDGHYEFLVMPFGLSNAPSTFQAAIYRTLKPYLRRFVVVFFDDILVYSSSIEEHCNHLQQVLGCLLRHEFYVKLSKCIFCQELIECLGHVILQ